MARPKKSVQDKVRDDHPEFAEAVQGLSVDELNARLAQLAKDAEAVSEAADADNALESARQHAAELAAPYRDAKKALKLKTKFVIELVKERS